jgi:hypothetical protein
LRVSNRSARTVFEDLDTFLPSAAGDHAWLLFPGFTDPTHWSYGLKPELEHFPETFAKHGCQTLDAKEFDQVLLISLNCRLRAAGPGP